LLFALRNFLLSLLAVVVVVVLLGMQAIGTPVPRVPSMCVPAFLQAQYFRRLGVVLLRDAIGCIVRVVRRPQSKGPAIGPNLVPQLQIVIGIAFLHRQVSLFRPGEAQIRVVNFNLVVLVSAHGDPDRLKDVAIATVT
jgi:hypothetical protein